MRYLIDGCYGDGNIGDECLLDAIRSLIRRHDCDAKIKAMSSDVAGTRAEHGIPAVAQCNPFGLNLYGSICKGLLKETIAAIRDCDVFVLGGGELVRDNTGITATLGMFYRMQLAKQFGKHVVALGIGAQAPTTWWGRYILGTALRSADALLFRDPSGLRIASEIADDSLKRAHWAPDPVFSLDWKPKRLLEESAAPVVHLGIAVKSLPSTHASHHLVHHSFPRLLRETLDIVRRNLDLRLTFLSFSDSDKRLAQSICASLESFAPTVTDASRESILDAFSRVDALLAMPLHASVFSFASGVPAIGLSYDAKVGRLYKNFGLSNNCFTLAELASQPLARRTLQVLEHRSSIRKSLLKKAKAASHDFEQMASQLLWQSQTSVPPMSSLPLSIET